MKISTGELEAHALAERRVMLKTEAQARSKKSLKIPKGIRIRKSKNGQHSGQQRKVKRRNNDLETYT